MQIVWFKRDLRVNDHAPLSKAIAAGAVIPLYILEPDLWQQADMSHRQYMFLRSTLIDLDAALRRIGGRLIVRVGDAVSVLERLRQTYGEINLFSHQETWNHWTYDRDLRVKAWAKKNQIIWHEFQQYGVVRRLKDRDGWAAKWYKVMTALIIDAPTECGMPSIESDSLPVPKELGLLPDGCTKPQQAGRENGLACLNSFLYERGEGYTTEMSSPVSAFESCSRLSPYIAFGSISLKEVFQATEKRVAEIKALPGGDKRRLVTCYAVFFRSLALALSFYSKIRRCAANRIL